MARRKILVPLWLFGACLIVVGLMLAISGFYLISLGGSAYYFTFGLLLMVSGALVCRTRASGAWVYLAAFSLTLGWAFWEVGLDVWRLLPRLDGPIALGLGFLTPWIQFRQYRYEGIFTPQTAEGQGSLIYPGHYGVFNWGGVAVDPKRGNLTYDRRAQLCRLLLSPHATKATARKN